MPGWTPTQFSLLIALPILVVASALFSGSETAMFGLRAHHLSQLHRRQSAGARAALSLLRQPNMLLITLLLGNMLVNVLYFVISSVLILAIDMKQTGPILPAAFGLASLVIMILTAEVAPKLVASRNALAWVILVSVPLLVVHDLIFPIRVAISSLMIQPILRLVGTRESVDRINYRELSEFLEVARKRGDISGDEERLLRDIVDLRRLKVRDVMAPRVRLIAVEVHDATRDTILQRAKMLRDRYLPIYEGSIDRIVGMLDLQDYLLTESGPPDDSIIEPSFIPDLATLDHLLEHFRDARAKAIVAVDEFGQTSGIVTFGDVIQEIIGSRATVSREFGEPIMMVSVGRWRIAPELNVYDFAEAFNIALDEPRYATVSGMMMEHLGDIGHIGDEIVIQAWRLRIVGMDGPRITDIEVEPVE